MNSAFRAVKGDDGLLAYTGSTFPLAKGKYREYNKILYRSKQTITGGTFNPSHWDVIGVSSGSSVITNLILAGLTGTTTGTTLTLGLSETGVAAGSYNYSRITVDKRGRISSASSLTAISGFTATAGLTGATSGAGSGKTVLAGLANTSVTPGTYQKATLTVDAKGRITFASGNTLAGVNGIGLTGNTFGLTRTGVAAGTYQRATITVDERGRISFASGNTASGGAGATPGGVNGSIQFKQGIDFSGTNAFIYQSPLKALTIGTRGAGSFTGDTSVAIGSGNYSQNTNSVAIGISNVASGIHSFMIGRSNSTAGSYVTAFGSGNTINTSNDYSFAAGRGNSFNASTQVSQAFGMGNIVQGSYAMAIGFKNKVQGLGSFAGGYNESAGGDRPNLATGKASFAFSYTDTSQTLNHGANAHFSAILGGRNNNIATANTGATIIGGNSVKLSSAGYSYHAAVSNLAIFDTPPAGSTDDILTWNATSKKVGKITQGSVSGVNGLTATRIPYAASATSLADSPLLVWDVPNGAMTVGNMRVFTKTTNGIFMGSSAGNFTLSGLFNIGIGSSALFSLSTGTNNVMLGHTAGGAITTGHHNIGIGVDAIGDVTTQNGNIGIGTNAISHTTGFGNIAIGHNVGTTLTSGSQNLLIGYNLEPQSITTTGQLSIQNIIFGSSNVASGTSVSTGNIGVAVPAPTARLHLPSGQTTSGKAPLKLTSGNPLTSPEDGAVEYHNSHLYFTIGSTRHQLDQQGVSGTYTPTYTAIAGSPNGFEAYPQNYMKVGNMCMVAGVIDFDHTAGTTVAFKMTLPITPSFGAIYSAGGGVSDNKGGLFTVQAEGSAGNEVYFNSGTNNVTGTNTVITYSLMYKCVQ
jgi:trimeric autotransporter adhesin